MSTTARVRRGSSRTGAPPVPGKRRAVGAALAAAALAGGLGLVAAAPASAVVPTSIKPGGLSRFCAAVDGHMIGSIACVLPNGVTVVCSPLSKKCTVTNLDTSTPPTGTGPTALPHGPVASAR